MSSRYHGIATSAATAAAALLLQITLAVATAPIMLLGTTMKTTSMAASSSSRSCNKTCGDHATDMLSSYPFGFSPDCLIQLNCTPDGTAAIGDFPVRNITSDAITVSVSTMCDRPFRTIDPLFGQNFAPTSENEVLLGNCTPPSPCRSQPSILSSQFQPPCNTSSGTTSCYYGKESGSGFLSYGKLSDMKCGILASSITELQLGTNQSLQLEGQTIQLGWWGNGDECKCSKEAECTRVSSIPGGGNGYRCQCITGSVGDGFIEGSGCFNVTSTVSKLAYVVLLIVVLISAVAGICLFLCVYCCIKGKCCPRRNKSHEKNVDVLMRSHGSSFPRRYKYCDLKKLTSSFSEKLGEGGYGKVYKGQLRDDGRLVAVKILKDSKDNGEEFINEVASISKTAHINIVELLGFCYEGKKRALLYDYMSNGSLDKFLPKLMDQGSPNCPLEWTVLHQIAVGIARGLEYLHRGCNTRILHFDIKPQNILLDQDFTPKISDFGLAKLCKGKDSFVSMLGTRGTIGYIAPEVFSRTFGVVSHKSDVYSYGMLVLEMIGGKDRTSVEASRSSEMYFPDWIYEHLQSGKPLWMSEINCPEDEEIARKMMLVSLWCIQTHPINRPPMSKVIDMLEGSFEQLGVPPKPHLSSPQGQELIMGSTTMSSSVQSSSALQNSKG